MLNVSRSTKEEREVLIAALRQYEQAMRATMNRARGVRVRNDASWRAWQADELVRQIVNGGL